MLHSMTGFGEAQYEAGEISFSVEIKSLNNRFLKTSIRLSDAVSFAECEVERLIREVLSRGAINYTLHFRHNIDTGVLQVNQTVLQGYVKSLEQVLSLQSGKDSVRIDLSGLLQMPGVCQSREYSEDEHKEFLKIIRKLTRQALKKLQKMRAEEGKGILKDLQQQCNSIKSNLEALCKLTDGVVENYHGRIQKRVNELLSKSKLKIDEEQLAKEVAIFAERSDINEEISRLNSHLQQFANVCESDEQAGRRLDFLTQEMLREANTIASKAYDARITQHVVEIKVAIDRLREQAQNVE